MRNFVKRTSHATLALFMSFVCAISLMGAPTAAFADPTVADEAIEVTGVDYFETTSNVWEFFRVDNLADKAVYLDVTKVGADGSQTKLTHRQEYKVSEDAVDGEGTKIAHIVSMNMVDADGQVTTIADEMADMTNHATYTVTVWAAPRGSAEPLGQFGVYPVYAVADNTDDNESPAPELVGIRTVTIGQEATPKNMGVGQSFYSFVGEGDDQQTIQYKLIAQDGVDVAFDEATSSYVAQYEQVSTGAVNGSINYIDLEGNVIRPVTVYDISPEGTPATIEKAFFFNGKYYRTVGYLGSSEIMLYPTRANYTVRVMEVAGMDTSAYQLTVRFEDEDGTLLWSDALDVKGKGYQYALPKTFSMKFEAGVNYYSLQGLGVVDEEGGVAPLSDDAQWTETVDLSTALDEGLLESQGDGTYVLTARYASQDVEQRATFVIREIDGSTHQQLGNVALEITPDQAAEYIPEAKEIDGVTYVPWTGNTEPLRYTWSNLADGIELMQNVYYVPEGYVPSEAYDITVQYVSVPNGEILRTETITVSPELTDAITITGDERFTLNGTEYIRMNGQEQGIRHRYFDNADTYSIYYYDANDAPVSSMTVSSAQIMNSTNTVPVPGQTVYQTVTTTVPTAAPAAADAGAAAPAATAPVAAVQPGTGTVVIDDEENPLTNGEAQTTTQERTIDENDNPLASAGGESADAAADSGALSGVNWVVPVGVGAVVVVALAALAHVLYHRRKNEQDQSKTQA